MDEYKEYDKAIEKELKGTLKFQVKELKFQILKIKQIQLDIENTQRLLSFHKITPKHRRSSK